MTYTYMKRAVRIGTDTYATPTREEYAFWWFAGHAHAMSNVQSCGVSIYERTVKRDAFVHISLPLPARYYYFMYAPTAESLDTRTNRRQRVRVATENTIGETYYAGDTREDDIVNFIVLYGPHREVRFRNMRMHHFWGVALPV